MTIINKNDRYSRQLNIGNWGVTGQQKLFSSKIFVAGCGGLASPVLTYLTQAGIGTIYFCDNDTVDITNLNRQFLHGDSDIGDLKAFSAKKFLHKLNNETELIAISAEITEANFLSIVPDDIDLIIDCLDNFETRKLLNRVSIERHIPLIHGGVAELQGQITFLNPPNTPCLECFMPQQKTGNKKFNVTGPTPGVIGSLQALEAIKYFIGSTQLLTNKLLIWDGWQQKFTTINITKNPDCPICKNL